jgi:DNA-binding response OmpR family regulator
VRTYPTPVTIPFQRALGFSSRRRCASNYRLIRPAAGQRGVRLARLQVAQDGSDSLNEDRGSAPYAPKILIVEDNLRYAIELMRALKVSPRAPQSTSFDVDVTHNAADALKYLADDKVDIYIIDLKLDDETDNSEGLESGKNLVKQIVEKSNAGVIVHSSLPAETDAAPLLLLGIDDYIEKPSKPEIIRAKTLALWRRLQLVRPHFSGAFLHTNRVFQVGPWRFTVGNRDLKNDAGEINRLSATEHSVLRHLCTVQDHEIDRETFNLAILGRPVQERDRRMDTFIYKLRTKLGDEVRIISKRDGKYKLLSIQELDLQIR